MFAGSDSLNEHKASHSAGKHWVRTKKNAQVPGFAHLTFVEPDIPNQLKASSSHLDCQIMKQKVVILTAGVRNLGPFAFSCYSYYFSVMLHGCEPISHDIWGHMEPPVR